MALITGAARRIGAVIAKSLHAQGYNIIIHYRQSAIAANTLCNVLNTAYPQSATLLQADFDDFAQIKTLAAEAQQLWGRLDVLVNNASAFFPTPVKKAKAKSMKPTKVAKPAKETKPISARPSAPAEPSLGFEPYERAGAEEYMNEEQLKHFEHILLIWKAQLMQEVDSTVVHMKEDAMVFPDPLDRASQEEGFSLELRTRDRERKLIKKIEHALDAIKNGVYGYCEDCGAEIGIRRLEARPTADKCIDCKTYEEIREKQIGGG